MTAEQTYPFPLASKCANYILELLKPHCEHNRIHIAGSIRRIKPEVKDIEIVCIPKKQIISRGLFGEEEYEVCTAFINALAAITHETFKGIIGGRYMQIITNSKNCPGIRLDLFMPQPEDYFRMYAIRTGSWEYSKDIIATAWKKKGWVGVSNIGLRKISECDFKTDAAGKKTYFLKEPQTINYKPQTPPVWTSEAEFFTWLGLEYIDPEHRELHKPINTAQ